MTARLRSPEKRLEGWKSPKYNHSEVELVDINRVHGDDRDDTAVTDSLLGHKRSTMLRGNHDPATPSPHPLFPPLPSYGVPSLTDSLWYLLIRCVSFVLSLCFLGAVVVGALVHCAREYLCNLRLRVNGKDPNARRIFQNEEQVRQLARDDSYRRWKRRQDKKEVDEEIPDESAPVEGGKDPIVCDVAYYARRVGLDVETFQVQTEDGFILTLWHVFDPQEYTSLPATARQHRGPQVFTDMKGPESRATSTNRRYPVLLVHGLLQSAGAYCVNDDDSLAFYLAKSGYDVWLGNNRCALRPEHATLPPSDPRMWTWNLQQMGTLDLSAMVSRVLYETGFEKLGLVCHSQGSAETFVALSKDQRPELGQRISVFCALAPAAYAGPLIERVYFRFMRVISPSMFSAIFGIHSFIPFMMTMHDHLPPRVYGWLGFFVFSFLFGWSDTRWDRGLRNRMFQFAPVYVSTETMRWWLGPDGFAKQKCILSTHETGLAEIEEDHRVERGIADTASRTDTAWFGPESPPMALWVAGSDDLVDGRRLLRRLQNGREPHVDVVHAKVIDGYEHLDVLWAMDAVEQVGQEVREVLWTTMPDDARAVCRVPQGCSLPGSM